MVVFRVALCVLFAIAVVVVLTVVVVPLFFNIHDSRFITDNFNYDPMEVMASLADHGLGDLVLEVAHVRAGHALVCALTSILIFITAHSHLFVPVIHCSGQ